MLVVLANKEEPDPMPAPVQKLPISIAAISAAEKSDGRRGLDEARVLAIVEAEYILEAIRR